MPSLTGNPDYLHWYLMVYRLQGIRARMEQVSTMVVTQEIFNSCDEINQLFSFCQNVFSGVSLD